MNIYGPETERCRELQRQLHEAEQFRALVRDYRLAARRYARCDEACNRNMMLRLRSMVDAELRLLPSE